LLGNMIVLVLETNGIRPEQSGFGQLGDALTAG
jgi:hypothetical protein